jgi:phosphohistidine phosphatase SixA
MFVSLTRASLLLAVALLSACSFGQREAETVVILVRHADRVDGADALTPDGKARGEALVHVLEKAGLTAIVHSDAARATQTAAPVVAATRLVPVALPGGNTDAFVREILDRHAGGTVLVVGHSNTVPKIVAGLGGPQLPDIDHAEYDTLLVLTLGGGRAPRLTSLQYGKASP